MVDDEDSLASIARIHLPPAETFVREGYRRLSLAEVETLQPRIGLLASMFPESWQETETERGDTADRIYFGRTIRECPMMFRCAGRQAAYVEQRMTRRESQPLFGPSIKQDAPLRYQLIEKIEVRNVAG